MEYKEYYCIQCDLPFEVSQEQLDRLKMLGFDEPTRCPVCRKRKSRPNYSEGSRKKHKNKKLSDGDTEPNRKRGKFKRTHGEFWESME